MLLAATRPRNKFLGYPVLGYPVAFAADKLGDASRALRQIDTFAPDGLATLAREAPTGALSKLDDAGRLVTQLPNGGQIGGQATGRFVDDLASTRIDATMGIDPELAARVGGGNVSNDLHNVLESFADDIATLKSIRRHVERLAKNKALSSDPNTMAKVRALQRHILNGNYKDAGKKFHTLNFHFAREAQSRGGLRGLNIDKYISTPNGILSSRRPDYRFNVKIVFDLKPTRNSLHAYDNTDQFQDIYGALGFMPIPLYYRLWVL